MTAEDAAYAALGLRRGAPRAQVDEAYRRLMKVHHPDRTGGDGGRAAEINRAYTLLRRDRQRAQPVARPHRRSVPVQTKAFRPAPRRSSSIAFLLAVAAVVAAGAYANNRLGDVRGSQARVVPLVWTGSDSAAPAVAPPSSIDFSGPIHARAVAKAIALAERFQRENDLPGAADYSSACQSGLRQKPTLQGFDACTAFDEATLLLSAENPLIDPGPFEGSQVVSREVAAANLLSSDVVDIDFRIREIRSAVELTILSKMQSGGDYIE